MRTGRRGVLTVMMLAAILAAAGCGGLPQNFSRPVSTVLTETSRTTLADLYDPLVDSRGGCTGVVPLTRGKPAMAARATLAQMAVKSIDAQYYLIHNDLTGMMFIHELIKAADRGVRVRLLVDDMGLWNRTKGAVALAAHPNVDVRIFNPFSRKSTRWSQMVYRFGSVTRRMHNKSFIVDNKAAILGGRNIGDEYFDADPDIEFGDMDILAVGPVVGEVSSAFDQYWNCRLSYPAEVLARRPATPEDSENWYEKLERALNDEQNAGYLKMLYQSPIIEEIKTGNLSFYWAKATALYDAPEKILEARDLTDAYLFRQLAPHFNRIRSELIIFSPYFVPGEEGVEYLAALCRRGIRVKVLTNSLASTDVPIVHAGYKRYRKALLRGGVELYELDRKLSRKERKAKKGKYGASKASLHTKSFVLDRRQVFIGSLNLDPRSFVENTEIGVMVGSPELARDLAQWFDVNVGETAFSLELRVNENGPDQIRWHRERDGRNTVYLRDPGTSLFKRAWVGFLGLLPIESQL